MANAYFTLPVMREVAGEYFESLVAMNSNL